MLIEEIGGADVANFMSLEERIRLRSFLKRAKPISAKSQDRRSTPTGSILTIAQMCRADILGNGLGSSFCCRLVQAHAVGTLNAAYRHDQ